MPGISKAGAPTIGTNFPASPITASFLYFWVTPDTEFRVYFQLKPCLAGRSKPNPGLLHAMTVFYLFKQCPQLQLKLRGPRNKVLAQATAQASQKIFWFVACSTEWVCRGSYSDLNPKKDTYRNSLTPFNSFNSSVWLCTQYDGNMSILHRRADWVTSRVEAKLVAGPS